MTPGNRTVATLLVLFAADARAEAPSADRWEYYLDPPSPPYCTPFYDAPGCFPFGDFGPRDEARPKVQIVPLPLSWLSEPGQIVYSVAAQTVGAEGVVEALVEINSEGAIVRSQILASGDPLLEQAVVEAISRLKPRPGEPGIHRFRVRFELRE